MWGPQWVSYHWMLILLSSGVSITWSHHRLINNIFIDAVYSIMFTVLLGVYFLIIQYLEYTEASFTIADGIYGTTFYLCTGFHGFHVIVGTVYLFYVMNPSFYLLSSSMILTFCRCSMIVSIYFTINKQSIAGLEGPACYDFNK